MSKDFDLYFLCVFLFCFCTDIGQDTNDFAIRHGISLIEISCRRGKLSIGSAVWLLLMIFMYKNKARFSDRVYKKQFFQEWL